MNADDVTPYLASLVATAEPEWQWLEEGGTRGTLVIRHGAIAVMIQPDDDVLVDYWHEDLGLSGTAPRWETVGRLKKAQPSLVARVILACARMALGPTIEADKRIMGQLIDHANRAGW